MESEQQFTNSITHYTDVNTGIMVMFMVMALISTALRLFSRLRLGSDKLGWDDWLVVPAVACLEALLLLVTVYQVKFREMTLYPDSYATPANTRSLLKMGYVLEVFLPVILTLPKLSICCLYLRILHGSKTKLLTKGLLIILIANGVAFFWYMVFFCGDPRNNFDINPKPGKCLDVWVATVSRSIPHIVTDLVMLYLPFPTIHRLRLPLKQRVGVALTLLTGSVGLVACVARLVYFVLNPPFQVATPEQIVKQYTIYVNQQVLTVLEPTMYLIAANLPPCGSSLHRLACVKYLSEWASSAFSPGGTMRTPLPSFVQQRNTTAVKEDVEMQPVSPRQFENWDQGGLLVNDDDGTKPGTSESVHLSSSAMGMGEAPGEVGNWDQGKLLTVDEDNKTKPATPESVHHARNVTPAFH
ncbi:MAG: hypothetical protein M1831_006288 [Alyxoria varia]|nr:MAG: hypothetical protein M1831_006288 [Alyxoria varia]